MITREEADGLRDELLALLAEDAHNAHRLIERLDALWLERGASPYAALLLLLTRMPFEESEARRHWEEIVERQQALTHALGRDPGVRVAVLDHFVHANRMLVRPRLIDLEVADAVGVDPARDGTTGLLSDRAFRTALQREVRRARRYGEGAALVLFDFDGFATVNRRVGRSIGDRLLREAALLLSNRIRDIDLAGRPGEDEMALLLPETDRGGALRVAERFRAEVEGHFGSREAAGQPVGITVSAGIAVCPEDATDAESLLRCAAQALYLAKAAGKNATETYRPERRRFRRFEIEPGRFEVEVLDPSGTSRGRPRDVSRGGILFLAPEPLEIGTEVEIRPSDGSATVPGARLRGTVVRVEALATAVALRGATIPDRFEIGLELDGVDAEGATDLLDEFARAGRGPDLV